MIHIRKLQDCHLLTHDPDLQREVTSYLLYCKYELQEYDDDPDFNFSVMSSKDIPTIRTPGIPEEIVEINIKADGHIITMYRIIYPTEVIFIPAEASTQFSF